MLSLEVQISKRTNRWVDVGWMSPTTSLTSLAAITSVDASTGEP